ncbi:hypothetical protein GCM10020258_38760 [Sphingomonas yabuuchiae]
MTIVDCIGVYLSSGDIRHKDRRIRVATLEGDRVFTITVAVGVILEGILVCCADRRDLVTDRGDLLIGGPKLRAIDSIGRVPADTPPATLVTVRSLPRSPTETVEVAFPATE